MQLDLNRLFRTASNTPTARELEGAKRFRRSVGFRYDDAYVTWVHDDPANRRSEHRYGPAVLTRLELDELHLRQEVISADVGPVTRYAESHRATYGGLFLDHLRGGKLCVGFTDQVEPHASRLRRIVSFPSRLLVEHCRFTEDHLFALRDRVTESVDLLRASGVAVRYVASNVQRNRVVVGVFPLNDAVRKVIIDRLEADDAAIELLESERGAILQAESVRTGGGAARATAESSNDIP